MPMAPVLLEWLLAGVVYTVAVFYGLLVSVKLLFDWAKQPTKALWRTKTRVTPPACLTDPRRGNHGFANLQNIKLHYVEKGDKTKPLMLFLHGYPEFWYSWRYQMDEFSKDFWTVAFDMRGYGDSDKPDGITNYVMDELVRDTKELAKFLGRDKFTLVAHDWGGAVAWSFLQTHPEMLERFIIIASVEPTAFWKVITSNLSQILKSWYMFFFQLPYLPELSMRWNDMLLLGTHLREGSKADLSVITDEDIEAFKYTFGKPGAFTAPINYYRMNIFNAKNFKQSVNLSQEKIDSPVPGLIIAGAKDKFLDVKILELTGKRYNNLKTEVIAGGGHFLQQNVPKTINNIMSEFVRDK